MLIFIILLVLFIVIGLFIYSIYNLINIHQINHDIDVKNNELKLKYIELNNLIEKEKQELSLIQNENLREQDKLDNIQNNISKTLDNQKELSQKAFENYCEVLENQYKEYEEEYEQYKDALETAYSNKQIKLMQEMSEIQKELDKIKETRAAVIQALTREKEMEENTDDFRLDLSEIALKDIKLLKSIQSEITNSIVIDKIIWSNYYQPLAKIKFPKIIGKSTACGIYKITSIKSKVCYIGQSLDCCDRWKQHCKNALGVGSTTGTNKLYQLMKKEGLHNFTFEILEECNPEYLDEKEKYYINLYNSYNFGLNGNKGNG